MRDLRQNEIILLSLVSNALFDSERIIPDNVKWDEIIKESAEQAILPIAFSVSKKSYLSKDIEKDIQNQLFAYIANNMKVCYGHEYVDDLFRKKDIRYVVLKGCASSNYYQNPIYRTMGDVDFLVHPSDIEKAKCVLIEDGFISWEEEHLCHIVFKKDDMHFEMHLSPSGMPDGEVGELVNEYINDIFDTAVSVVTKNGGYTIPDDFHHGLILLLHTVHHLTGEGIGLRHLCDWAVFVNSFSDERFREMFEDKLTAIGLWRAAQLFTQLSIRYLGMPEKNWAMENVCNDLLQDMICDIFEGGNFGQKEEQRSNQAYLISSRGKHGVGNTSMIKQLFISVSEAVKVHFPLCQKNKLLFPIGFMMVCSKYVVLIVQGKRKKLKIGEMISGASKRKKIYKELKIFEIPKKK